jgi:hypothetical protein
MPKLSANDEHFVHQIPEPLSVVAIEHQHWRESYFFVTHGPTADSDVLVVAMASYPPRHMLDALVLGRVDSDLMFAYHQREAGDDPHSTTVGPVAVEVVKPYEELRVVVSGDASFEADLTFRARTRPYALRRGRMLADDGSLLWDQSHMIQSGTFEGTYSRGGKSARVDGWLGQRDHSWGVRDHGRIPMWMWLAIQLEDGMLGVWHWELANGAHVFTDGCWAPADGTEPVQVVAFSHDLWWSDENGERVEYGNDGDRVAGISGSVSFTLAGGKQIELSAEGSWCAPYKPIYGGGQHLVSVSTADGRSGTAIFEVTGQHHHRFFPTQLDTAH